MIYFMQPVDGGPVKIGYSDDVDARHRQLEAHYGRPLTLLATMPGGPDEEAEIHGRFSHLRFGRTEQFRPGPDLMAFVGRPLLVGANPDAAEAMPGRPKSDRDDVTIRVSRPMASKLKVLAGDRGVTVAEIADELFGAVIDRAYAKLMRRLEGDQKNT